ncbi:Uncharacterized protein Adt_31043 [Abeliophyllum distichum]|uniref:Uncharacterized protein n=1 Tax=Abeliophyllum distichum TaxID=126358 RepID=A0ABD1RCY8_9LAMI
MAVPLPRDFKQPKMEKYDGSSDPVDHLRATLGIKELQMSTVVTAMISGTRNRHFKMSLYKNPPNTMHGLVRRGKKYVDAEEAYLITKGTKDRSEPESNKRKILDELEPQNNIGELTQDETR